MGRGTTQTERSAPLQPGTPEYAAEVERQRLKQAQNEADFLAQMKGATQQKSSPLQPGTPEYAAAVQSQQLKQADIDKAFSAYHGISTPLQPGTPEYAAQIEQQRLKQVGMDKAFSEQMNAAQQQAGGGAAAGDNRPGYQVLGGESDGFLGTGIGWEDIIPGLIQYGIGKATETSPKDVGQDYGKAYGESYEEIMKAHRGEAEAMMQKELDLQRQFDPQKQRLVYEGLVGSEAAKMLPEGYVPGIREHAQLGADVENITRRGAAGTDLDIMRMQGPYMAQATMDQLAQTDQPWMQTRDTGAQKVQELLGSINMGGLSGGERAEVERMNARRNLQRGQAGGGGNLTAIENAMQFGSALDRKRTALGNALQTATNFMAGSRSGYDPVQATLGRGSGTNQIAAGFQGVQPVKDYSSQMPTLPLNIMTGTNQGGFLGTMQQGKNVVDQWLGN